MAASLVCIMLWLSGAVYITDTDGLAKSYMDLLQHQYKSPPITSSNSKPDPEPPPI